MCGIAAIFAYNADAPGVDRDELVAIRDQMVARGPDGCGEWISPDGRVGLAHRRLSIIDLSEAGAQPMWNTGRTLCVTFNGEIYNYRALRSILHDRGVQFHSNSDTEVLLHLYQSHGPDMVHHLRGMYAFAIWDVAKRSLFLARDPFGIKPLYYADSGRAIRVASQVKALLQSKHIDTAPEPAGHVGFFLWGSIPDPFTLYRGVRALPAGHTLTIAQSDHSESNIPAPKSFCSVPEILRSAGQEAADSQRSTPAGHELLRGSLADSVSHHLIADVPVGVFLSAGVDSTALTAFVAAEHQAVRTVTLGFEEYRGTSNDEVPLAETTARLLATRHRTEWITRADYESAAERLFDAMDQPSIDGVNSYFVSLAARRTGLKVALSGLGGDELFAGYPSFHDIPRTAVALRAFSAVPSFGRAVRAVTAPLVKRCTSPKYAGLLEFGGTYSGAYLLRRGLFMPWELPEVLDPELVRAGWSKLQPFLWLDQTHAAIDSARLKVTALESCCYMRNQLLRDTDWASMAHSLEVRVPLVDVQLLRSLAPLLASRCPPSKRDLALAPRSALPAEVITRPKTGFTVPVRDWLVQVRHGNGGVPVQERGLRGWAKHVYSEFTKN